MPRNKQTISVEEIQINYTTDLNEFVENDNREEVLINVTNDSMMAILDSAATKSVAGRKWIEKCPEEMRRKIKLVEDHRNFKFGNDVLFPSKEPASTPIQLGTMEERILLMQKFHL